MNERIKQLADEAEKYALDNVGKGHYGIEDLIYQFQFVDTKMAKFAELIVRECMEVVLDSDPSPKMIAHEPYRTIMNNIQEYFGVEE